LLVKDITSKMAIDFRRK